jgi:hypothetical protein
LQTRARGLTALLPASALWAAAVMTVIVLIVEATEPRQA